MKTITVLNAKGKRRDIEVAAIEVPLEDGRLIRLAFPPGDMGDLVAEAHCDSGTPVILMQPGAANIATLHVLAVGEPEPEFELELAVQKALQAACPYPAGSTEAEPPALLPLPSATGTGSPSGVSSENQSSG